MGPLLGRTTTFVFGGRADNLAFARSMLPRAVGATGACTIFDADALYASNAEYVMVPLADSARQVEVVVPEPDSDLEAELAQLLGAARDGALVLDSLNSLYHLLPAGGRSSKSRNLAYTMALLAYLAREEGRTVLLTMYERDRTARFGRGKSISELSDITTSVRPSLGALTMRCERGTAWPGGTFTLPMA